MIEVDKEGFRRIYGMFFWFIDNFFIYLYYMYIIYIIMCKKIFIVLFFVFNFN